MNDLSLNQQSYLLGVLKDHTKIGTDILWSLAEHVTEKQYRFLLALSFKGDQQLDSVLENMIRYYRIKEKV